MSDKITIDIELGNVEAATAALHELAVAADKAREAIDKLFGASDQMTMNVHVGSPLQARASAIEQRVCETKAAIERGVRPVGKRFSL